MEPVVTRKYKRSIHTEDLPIAQSPILIWIAPSFTGRHWQTLPTMPRAITWQHSLSTRNLSRF